MITYPWIIDVLLILCVEEGLLVFFFVLITFKVI